MAMNLNTYTEKAQEALLKAQAIAVENGNSQIDPEHLLNALLTQEGGITPAVISAAGGSPTRINDA